MGDCTLKASQYPLRVLSELHKLYSNGHLVDTTITLAECGTNFCIHKCVLVAAFPFFKKLMEKQQLSDEVILKNINSEGFQRLLSFVYTGDLELSDHNVKVVMRAAQKMQVPEAVGLCRQFVANGHRQTETHTADASEQVLESGNLSPSSDVVDHIKSEPVSFPTEADSVAQPAKRGRGRKQKVAEDQSSMKTTSTRSKRQVRKPKHLEEEGYRAPQVTGDMKLKLYRVTPGEKRKHRVKDRKCEGQTEESSVGEVAQELEEPSELETEPLEHTSRKRGRPRKEKEAGSPSKKVKVKEEGEEAVGRKTKRVRKPRAISVHTLEDETVLMTETLPHLACPACSYRFYHQSTLQLHLRKHHIFTRVATVTRYYTAVARLRTGHLMFHQLEGNCGYVCRTCNKMFQLRGRCIAHVMKVHLRKRTCSKCSQNIGHHRSRLQHRCLKSRALCARVHLCSRCFQVFKSQGLLERHWQQVHTDAEKGSGWVCRHCSRRFVQKHVYISHLMGHGLGDKEVQLEFIDPTRVPLRGSELILEKNKSSQLPFKCPTCTRRYKTQVDLNIHVMSRHNQKAATAAKKPLVKRIRCEENDCEQTFGQMRELRHHITTEHPDCTYDCYQCKYSTPIKQLLRSHLKYKHTTIQDRTCQECGKHFKKRYHYRIHMVSKHGAEDAEVKVFRCEAEGCDYKTYAKYVLDIHARKHDKEKNFACTICGRKLKSQKAVEKHTNKVHKGIRPFICDICGASYGEEHELKMHIVRHNDVKQYQCEHCEYATHDKGNFQSHQFNKHKVPSTASRTQHQCDYCGFVTIHKSRFTEHMNTHTKEKPYACSVCNMCFGGKSTLRDHMRWKHSKVRVKCDFCSFTAPTKFNLKTHMRIMHTHRNLKPYKCVYCNYRCNLSGNCRKHIKQKHKGMEIKWVKITDGDADKDEIEDINTSANAFRNAESSKAFKTEELARYSPDSVPFSTMDEKSGLRTSTLVEAAYNIAVAQHDANPSAGLEEVSSLYQTAGFHPSVRFPVSPDISNAQALSYFEGGLGYTLYPQQNTTNQEGTSHCYSMPHSYH